MSDKYPGLLKKKVLCILCNQNLSISTTKHDCFYRQKKKTLMLMYTYTNLNEESMLMSLINSFYVF